MPAARADWECQVRDALCALAKVAARVRARAREQTRGRADSVAVSLLDLPHDCLLLIANKLDDIGDAMALFAACRSLWALGDDDVLLSRRLRMRWSFGGRAWLPSGGPITSFRALARQERDADALVGEAGIVERSACVGSRARALCVDEACCDGAGDAVGAWVASNGSLSRIRFDRDAGASTETVMAAWSDEPAAAPTLIACDISGVLRDGTFAVATRDTRPLSLVARVGVVDAARGAVSTSFAFDEAFVDDVRVPGCVLDTRATLSCVAVGVWNHCDRPCVYLVDPRDTKAAAATATLACSSVTRSNISVTCMAPAEDPYTLLCGTSVGLVLRTDLRKDGVCGTYTREWATRGVITSLFVDADWGYVAVAGGAGMSSVGLLDWSSGQRLLKADRPCQVKAVCCKFGALAFGGTANGVELLDPARDDASFGKQLNALDGVCAVDMAPCAVLYGTYSGSVTCAWRARVE